MSGLSVVMLCELSSDLFKVLNYKLRNILQRNRVEQLPLLCYILEQSVVPDNAFKWFTESSRSSVELISCLIKHRLCLDKKIESVVDILDDNGKEYLSCDEVDLLLRENNIELSLYEKYFVFTLLIGDVNSDDITYKCNQQFPAKNIYSNYSITADLVDDAFCNAARFADHKMMKNIQTAAEEHHLQCEIDPDSDSEHQKVLTWVQENVAKGCRSEGDLGWCDGPDSGKWPSTKLHDYIKTLDCLYESMF